MAGKDRKKELARQRYERQQQRRRAQEARARRIKIIGVVAAVVVVAGGAGGFVAFTGEDDKSDTVKPQAKADGCAYTKAADDKGAPKDLGTPPAKPVNTGPVQATMKTSQGDLGITLDGAKAPCATNSFTYLAQQKYFNDTECHRLSASEGLKMLQCGDPTGSGMGGPGYQFADENIEGATYPKGTIAMANSGPGTNGSQFFLVYGDSQLPPSYTVFGKITKGLDMLEKVAKAGVTKPGQDGTGPPKKKVEIQSVAIAGK
ncbi:peptidylprolyl isomerase [Actinomadura sp. 9N407]|uniref:peptidylprolyl isomerase n=1 Tax=Actinomadura sp. 9N407 TaxID=3375154 RepID=UPI0037A866AE